MEAIEDEPRGTTTIRRLAAAGSRWRVRVETWTAAEGCRGRFVFEPDDVAPRGDARSGPPSLIGGSREDVVAAAYDFPEQRLRQLLNSLG